MTGSSLIVGRTTLEEDGQNTDILAFNRGNVRAEPELLTSFQDMTEVHLYSHQNTLVVLERRAVENMLTSIITIDNFKLSLWNSKTLGIKELVYVI